MAQVLNEQIATQQATNFLRVVINGTKTTGKGLVQLFKYLEAKIKDPTLDPGEYAKTDLVKRSKGNFSKDEHLMDFKDMGSVKEDEMLKYVRYHLKQYGISFSLEETVDNAGKKHHSLYFYNPHAPLVKEAFFEIQRDLQEMQRRKEQGLRIYGPRLEAKRKQLESIKGLWKSEAAKEEEQVLDGKLEPSELSLQPKEILENSPSIDSDLDGVPNVNDRQPFTFNEDRKTTKVRQNSQVKREKQEKSPRSAQEEPTR